MDRKKKAERAARLRCVVFLALAPAILAACVSTAQTPGGPVSPSGMASLQEVIVPVGRSVSTAAGNKVTVRAFVPFVARAAGSDVYAAADVEACAGARAPARTGVNRSLFAVETAGRTGWPSRDPVKQPALQSTYISPNHCTGGWVTFRVPKDQKVLFVVLLSSSVVKWQTT